MAPGLPARMNASTIFMLSAKLGPLMSLVPIIRSSLPLRLPATRRLEEYSYPNRTYVSGIERGVRNPTLRTIWRLAEALSTTPSALFKASEKRIGKRR